MRALCCNERDSDIKLILKCPDGLDIWSEWVSLEWLSKYTRQEWLEKLEAGFPTLCSLTQSVTFSGGINSAFNRRACMVRLVYASEAKVVCQDFTKWRSVVYTLWATGWAVSVLLFFFLMKKKVILRFYLVSLILFVEFGFFS